MTTTIKITRPIHDGFNNRGQPIIYYPSADPNKPTLLEVSDEFLKKWEDENVYEILSTKEAIRPSKETTQVKSKSKQD